MNKKGFTLVELLAVIVVLAIIALIGYMTVGDIIEGVQESADKETIREYAKAVEKARMSYLMNTGTDVQGSGIISSDWLTDNVKLEKSSVLCENVIYTDIVTLYQCKVNNSDDLYCYNGETTSNCNNILVGNTVQDGTPSPTNPVEVQGVGDKTNNLFDSEDWYTTLNAISSENMKKATVDGIDYYEFSPKVIYNHQYMEGEFKENTQYTLTFLGRQKEEVSNTSTGLRFNYTDGTYSSLSVDKTTTEKLYTITSISGRTIKSIQLTYNYNYPVYIRNIQLEEGTTATDYEPYGYKIPITVSNETTNIYLDEPLRKIGDIADYLDLNTGVVTRNIAVSNTSNITLGSFNDKDTYWYGFSHLLSGGKAVNYNKILSDRFPTDSKPQTSTSINYSFLHNDNSNYPTAIYYVILKTDVPEISTKEALQTWFRNLNANIYYQLEKPTKENVDISSLPNIDNGTNYSVDTKLQPDTIKK